MSASGDDLKKYLIVPSSPTFSFTPSSSSPSAAPPAKPLFSGFGIDSESRCAHPRDTHDEAEKPKMEIDTPTPLPMFGSAHAEEHVRANAIPLDDVLSMEDFMKQHEDEHQAQLLAREEKQTAPPAKKIKTDENAAPLTLIAVGARSSKHTILLHEKYQALGIPQPLFTYEGGSSSGWTVSISFPGLENAEELQGLAIEKKFNSKQEAKEALSQKALAVLEELEKEGRIKKAEKGKRKSVGGSEQVVQQQQQQQKADKEPGENYVGQLLEFQRSTNSPQPTYTDYKSGNSFTCLLTIEGHATPFGSLSTLSSSKKAARQEAARHAVSHFKSQGVWPTDVTPVGGIKKKKKKAAPQPTLPDDSSPGLHPFMLSPSSPSSSSMSYAQQVAALAVILALPTPEWKYIPHPSDPTFHSVSCFFRGAGAHEGPVGTVRNVYGKKKAKEECARLTLEYLKEVREKRLAFGRRAMEGVKGGEGVVRGAEGKVGEKGMDMDMGMDMDGSSDDDVAFEDAEEGL